MQGSARTPLLEWGQVGRATPGPAGGAASRRERVLRQRGAVLWMTGLSGAGKTTLARALEGELLEEGVLPVVLDGDELREGLSRGLGFSVEDRRENVRRAMEAALLLAGAGLVVIVALISPRAEDRVAAAKRIRERGVPFAEIYVNAPLAVCEQRDPKGLYRRARSGQLPCFTGIDAPYEAPVRPDLEIHTAAGEVAESVVALKSLALKVAGRTG